MFGFWSIAQMSLFFTLIGLFNAFLMWPVALLLYFLGVELIVCEYLGRLAGRRLAASCRSLEQPTNAREHHQHQHQHQGRYIPWIHLTAAGALHLTANILVYFGPICAYDIFLTLGLLLAVVLSAGEF